MFEMYTRKMPPKLGSLQRWVRECDATVSADGTVRDVDAMRCLDLILRIASPAAVAAGSEGGKAGTSGLGGVVAAGRGDQIVRRKPVWIAREDVEGEIKIWDRIQRGALFGESSTIVCRAVADRKDTPPPTPYPNFRPVHHTPAHLRKPPNMYDSTVYGSSNNAIQLTPTSSRPRQPSRIDVPNLPGAFMVLDVFTPEECLQIVQAAEAIGFEQDKAAGGSATNKASVS